jgi:hypothetical protein
MPRQGGWILPGLFHLSPVNPAIHNSNHYARKDIEQEVHHWTASFPGDLPTSIVCKTIKKHNKT